MHGVDMVRMVVTVGFTLLLAGCASHHHREAATACPNPAKVVGNSRNTEGGWVIVRQDRSSEETAARIAKAYHVRTQPLSYLHGFSTYPMPQEPNFLCDKAVVEVHYAAPRGIAAR